MDAMKYASGEVPQQCRCAECLKALPPDGYPIPHHRRRMVLCQTCGNKRCPHAWDHRNVCTGSNEPGQVADRSVDANKTMDDGRNGLQVHDIVKCPQSSRAIIAEITHDHEWLVKVAYGDDGRFSSWCRPHECELIERSVKPVAPKLTYESRGKTTAYDFCRTEDCLTLVKDADDYVQQIEINEAMLAEHVALAIRVACEDITAERDELRAIATSYRRCIEMTRDLINNWPEDNKNHGMRALPEVFYDHLDDRYGGKSPDRSPSVMDCLSGDVGRREVEAWEAIESERDELARKVAVLEKKNAGSLANNLCPDCRDKCKDESCLRCQVQSLRRERDALKSDIDHAVSEAKRREPEYPWTLSTASECVWALGESLSGIRIAVNEWVEVSRNLQTELDSTKATLAATERRVRNQRTEIKNRLLELQSLRNRESFLEYRLKFELPRLIEWINDPHRKPAAIAFTSGYERRIADLIEMAIAPLQSQLDAATDDARRMREVMQSAIVEVNEYRAYHKPTLTRLVDEMTDAISAGVGRE